MRIEIMHPHENSIKPIGANTHREKWMKKKPKCGALLQLMFNSLHSLFTTTHSAPPWWNANYSYKYKMNANTNLRLEITTVKQTMANTTAVILPLKRTSSNRWMKRLHSFAFTVCITWVSLCVWRPHTTIKPSEWHFFVLSNCQCCIFASHHIISIVENEWIVDTFYRRELNATCIIQ